VAGEESVLPAPSTARTRKVCDPAPSPVYVCGLVHAANGAASRLHSKVAPVVSDVKSKVAVVSFVGPAGADVIVVSGAVVSTVQVRVAGVGSTFPAISAARTSKVWLPSESALYAFGLEHGENGAPSSLHSKLDPGSLEVNVNAAAVALVGSAGPEPIVVSGAVRSTIQVYEAGVGSTLPTASVALTWNVCAPAARPVYVVGLVQADATASTVHWNVDPALLELNVNVALVLFVREGG